MQTLTNEEHTVRTSALVIPFPVAHVLARAVDYHDGDLHAFRTMLTTISHNTDALRETRIRAAQQIVALEVALAAIAQYLPIR